MIDGARVRLAGEDLELLPGRALWWSAAATLIAGDLHWGKSGHFRKHGIAVSGASQVADARRLSAMLQQTAATTLIIAGDLFHSHHNAEVASFGAWRDSHAAVTVQLVAGDHDTYTRAHHAGWDMEVIEGGLAAGPFYITHDAGEAPGLHTIHGHLHPGVRIPGVGTLPACCIGRTSTILPAFGSFTGCATVDPRQFLEVYLFGDGKVLKLR